MNSQSRRQTNGEQEAVADDHTNSSTQSTFQMNVHKRCHDAPCRSQEWQQERRRRGGLRKEIFQCNEPNPKRHKIEPAFWHLQDTLMRDWELYSEHDTYLVAENENDNVLNFYPLSSYSSSCLSSSSRSITNHACLYHISPYGHLEVSSTSSGADICGVGEWTTNKEIVLPESGLPSNGAVVRPKRRIEEALACFEVVFCGKKRPLGWNMWED